MSTTIRLVFTFIMLFALIGCSHIEENYSNERNNISSMINEVEKPPNLKESTATYVVALEIL